MNAPLAYLDASAAVKLVFPESEAAQLFDELRTVRSWVSSEILEVEILCAVRRARALDRVGIAHQVLARIDLVEISTDVRSDAASEWTPPQRALDAIHLATVRTLPVADVVLYTYDRDQAAAARGIGLTVRSPGA